MNDEKYKKEFLSFIDVLFYSSHIESSYNSFILDFSDKKIKQYFIESCILWFKLVYSLEVDKDIIKNLYIKYTQHSVYSDKKETSIDKFIITKDVLENMFEANIIPRITYTSENTTIKKPNPDDYIK